MRNLDNSEITDTNVDGLITLKVTNSSGSDIAFDATVNTEKTVITVDPTSNFAAEQTVYVAIGATVEDTIGNVVAVSNVTFTTSTDNVAPTISSVSSTTPDSTYKIGDTIAITVTFSEAVTVTGTPQLNMETGISDTTADYTSGSSDTTLTFNYTVASGHSSRDLDYVSTTALALNSGTIKDAVGNAAVLTLPSPGETNSLGANKAIVVDGVIPTLTFTPVSGGTGVDVSSNIILTF